MLFVARLCEEAPMQTRNWTQRHSRIRRAFALANGALLWLLSGSAHAQTPTTTPPLGKSASTFPGSAGAADTLSRPQPTIPGNDTTPTRTQSKSRHSKVDFNKLFSPVSSANDVQNSVAAPSVASAATVDAPLPSLSVLTCRWPSTDCAMYWADPPSAALPAGSLPPGFPDSTILLPSPDDIGKDWSTEGPQDVEEPRNETIPTYRIDEQVRSAGPVDLEPVLESVYRAFLEENPSLLAFHLQRGEFMGLNTPGQTPGPVHSDLLLDRLERLFADRHTIALEYLRPYPMENDRFGVKAWYTYRDKAGNLYRAHLRFVVRPLDDRLILTSFALD